MSETTEDTETVRKGRWSRMKAAVYKKIEGRDDLTFTERVVALNEEQADTIEKLRTRLRSAEDSLSEAAERLNDERASHMKIQKVYRAAANEYVLAATNKAYDQAAKEVEESMIPEPSYASEPLEKWEEHYNENLRATAVMLRTHMTSNDFSTPLWDNMR